MPSDSWFYSQKGIIITQEPDNRLFKQLTDDFVALMKAEVKERLDGLDQRYWDFSVDNVVFTLHQEHYLGISLWITPESQRLPNVEAVGSKIEDVIRSRNGSRDGTRTR
jgi:hypothetical protein